MERPRIRNNSGTALITVMLLSTIGLIYVAGMMTSLSPVYMKVTQGKQEKILRSASEASLDWAISELNKSAKGQSGAIADDSTVDDSSVSTTSVPSSVLGDNGNCVVTSFVSVKNITAPSGSYLYDELLDSSNAASQLTSNGWRLVTGTAHLGNRTRRIQVVLKPSYVTQSSTSSQTTTTVVAGEPLKMPFSAWAMFSRGNFSANGNIITNGYDSRDGAYGGANVDALAGDVGSSGTAALTGSVSLGGDLNVYTAGSSSASGGTNSVVKGTLNTNGDQSGFTEGVNTGTGLPTSEQSDSLNTNLNAAPPSFPPAPTAPAGATNFGAISLSGNKTQTIVGPIDVIVSSIQVSGNAQLIINSSAGPVNIYVQGAASATPIHINGNGISNNGLPTGLRIFYNGSGDTHINGNADFKGLIYGPNSNVQINGNAHFYGSVVGKQMDIVGNSQFHYDKAFADTTISPYYTVAQQVTTTTTTPVTVYTKTMTDRRVVSWREL